MKRIVAFVIVGMLLIACGSRPADVNPSDVRALGSEAGDQVRRSVEIYAAVIRQLVTRDHTFGGAPSPFEHVYVVDGPVEDAGDPMAGDSGPREPFAEDVKSGLEERLSDLPPVEFVSDPDSVRLGKNGLKGVKNDGVIITVGPIAGDGDEVEVANSLWCGGLCGQWLTYVVELNDGHWEVTGRTGPSAIS